jgi:hypothetical protein
MFFYFQQNLQYQQHMALLQTEIDRSRADNVKLYEKIKFLQSYRGSGGQVSDGFAVAIDKHFSNHFSRSVECKSHTANFKMQLHLVYKNSVFQTAVAMTDDQTLEKYSSEYEQSLDPFRRFGVQVRFFNDSRIVEEIICALYAYSRLH